MVLSPRLQTSLHSAEQRRGARSYREILHPCRVQALGGESATKERFAARRALVAWAVSGRCLVGMPMYSGGSCPTAAQQASLGPGSLAIYRDFEKATGATSQASSGHPFADGRLASD